MDVADSIKRGQIAGRCVGIDEGVLDGSVLAEFRLVRVVRVGRRGSFEVGWRGWVAGVVSREAFWMAACVAVKGR